MMEAICKTVEGQPLVMLFRIDGLWQSFGEEDCDWVKFLEDINQVREIPTTDELLEVLGGLN